MSETTQFAGTSSAKERRPLPVSFILVVEDSHGLEQSHLFSRLQTLLNQWGENLEIIVVTHPDTKIAFPSSVNCSLLVHGESDDWYMEALGLALAHASNDFIGILGQSIQLLTPRIYELSLLALTTSAIRNTKTVVTVPTYVLRNESCRDHTNGVYEVLEEASFSRVYSQGYFLASGGSQFFISHRSFLLGIETTRMESQNEKSKLNFTASVHQELLQHDSVREVILAGEGAVLESRSDASMSDQSAQIRDSMPELLGPVGRFALPFLVASITALENYNHTEHK